MPEVYGHLGKYTDIDKDILQLENIKKNILMKGRKPNASGGIAGQLHLNQGGEAMPEHLTEITQVDRFKEMLHTRLLAMEDSSTPPDQLDINSISKYIKYLEEEGVDTNFYRDRFENLLKLQEPLAPVPESLEVKEGGRVSYTKGGLARILGA